MNCEPCDVTQQIPTSQVRTAQPTIPVGQVEEDPRGGGGSRLNNRGRGVSALPPIEPTESTTPTALRGSPR